MRKQWVSNLALVPTVIFVILVLATMVSDDPRMGPRIWDVQGISVVFMSLALYYALLVHYFHQDPQRDLHEFLIKDEGCGQ